MKLFRAYMDSASPSFLVARNGFPQGSEWLIESGNYLLTISMITEAAGFGQDGERAAAPRAQHSSQIEALIARWD